MNRSRSLSRSGEPGLCDAGAIHVPQHPRYRQSGRPGRLGGRADGKFNIEKALIGVNPMGTLHEVARDRFADRFIFDIGLDPNYGMDEVRRLRQLTKEYDVRAASVFLAAAIRRCRSTTSGCMSCTPPASIWACRSSSMPVCRVRGCRCTRSWSSISTRSAGSSPN